MPRLPRDGGPRGAALPAAVLLAQWRLVLGGGAQGALPQAPIIVDPDMYGGTCEWPLCSKKLVSCETKKVGTCVMPTPGCANKNAVCSLGRCNCPEYYCAVPGSTKECVPQFAYEGAQPGEFHRGPWLRMFKVLGSPDQFPDLSQLVDHPEGLISPRCIPAVILLLVGLTIAVATGMDLCEDLIRCVCCKRARRPASAEPGSVDETGHDNLTLVGLEWVDTEQPHRHTNEKEPDWKPVAALAGLVVLLSIGAVVGRIYNWRVTHGILVSLLDRLKSNAHTLSDESFVLNYTASNLSSTFTRVSNCEDNPLMSMLGGLAVSSAKELAIMVDKFMVHVVAVPDQVDGAKREIRDIQALAVYAPCIPMILMSIIAAGMLAEVLFTRYYGSAKTAMYEDKGLAACAGVFMLIIAVVAITCAALLSGMIGLAQQCDNIDVNLIEYVRLMALHKKIDPIFVNMTRHYLMGDVYNPLGGFADDIYTNVETVVELTNEYNQSIVHPQSLTCPPLNDLHVDLIGNVTKDTLDAARHLFNATNIYPYYQEIVHEGVCNHVLRSVGLLCIQQAVVGLIFFPFCAMLTHNYLAHHVSAQRSGLTGDYTTDDSDTEGVTEDAYAGPLKPSAVAPREVQR